MEDYQSIIQLASTTALMVMGWFAKQLWNRAAIQEEQLKNFQIEVAKNYVPHDRLAAMLEPIMESLREIKETLKNKVDK
jgi:hypothetical protein